MRPGSQAPANESGAGTLRAYVDEHAEERRRFAALREHLEGASYSEPLSLDLFHLHGRAYLELHQAHLARETALVLPLASTWLTEEDDERIVRGFREVDEHALPRLVIVRRLGKLERGRPTNPVAAAA